MKTYGGKKKGGKGPKAVKLSKAKMAKNNGRMLQPDRGPALPNRADQALTDLTGRGS